jgi:lysophospholipase L1-like esterase
MARWGGRFLLAGLAILLALACTEGVLRVSGLAPAPGVSTVTEGEFGRIPGLFSPGQSLVRAPGTRFEHRITINSLGYRGAELPRLPSAGELRVFLAGDSFTWGHNVDDHETLPARLEEALSAACTGPVRVINAGVSGSTILAQAALVERGLELEPDRVVIVFHENDIEELIHTRLWELLADNRRAKSRFPLSLVYPWARHTALWRLVVSATQSRRINVAAKGQPAPPPREEERRAAREEYARRAGEVVDLLSRQGIPLLYVTFPHPASVLEGEGGGDYRWALQWARHAGVATVDLLDPLRESGIPLKMAYLVPEDYHPGPAGHTLAARVLADALLADAGGPPPGCTTPGGD